MIRIALTIAILLVASGCPGPVPQPGPPPSPEPPPLPVVVPGVIETTESHRASNYASDLREVADQIRSGELVTKAQVAAALTLRFEESRAEAFGVLGEKMDTAGSLAGIEALLRKWSLEYEELAK